MEEQKVLTTREVQILIIEFIKQFREMAAIKKDFFKMNAEIKNVGFLSMIQLWSKVRTPNKRLYLPGELDNEFMTIVYKPAPNCIITIESVPTKKYVPSLKFKIYN